MSMTTEPLAQMGQCRCGAIHILAAGAPLQVSYCHCTDCRKQTGAPVSAFVGFPTDRLRIEGAPATYRSGTVTRSFCGRCGSPIAYEVAALPGSMWFYVGILDHPEVFAPNLHAFESERLPWFQIADDLPRHARFSVPREGEG